MKNKALFFLIAISAIFTSSLSHAARIKRHTCTVLYSPYNINHWNGLTDGQGINFYNNRKDHLGVDYLKKYSTYEATQNPEIREKIDITIYKSLDQIIYLSSPIRRSFMQQDLDGIGVKGYDPQGPCYDGQNNTILKENCWSHRETDFKYLEGFSSNQFNQIFNQNSFQEINNLISIEDHNEVKGDLVDGIAQFAYGIPNRFYAYMTDIDDPQGIKKGMIKVIATENESGDNIIGPTKIALDVMVVDESDSNNSPCIIPPEDDELCEGIDFNATMPRCPGPRPTDGAPSDITS